ncbi:MAG: hypothetical protein ACYC0V_08705 [Armatimonadota bacterium]
MKAWICIIITLFCFTSAVMASDAATPPVTDKSKEPVALLYKFAPDESVRYTISQKITGTQTTPGQNVKNINAELSAVVKLTYVCLYNDGTIDLSVKVESAAMKSDGKPVEGYTPSKDVIMMPFAVTGAMNLVSLSFGSIESMPFLLVFPNKDIALGAVWAQEIPVKNQWPSKVRLDYTFDNLTDQKALIKQKITTTTGKSNQKTASPATNLQEGSADIIFDMNTGKMISTKGSIKSSVSTLVGKVSSNKKDYDRLATTKLDSSFSVDIIIEEQPKSVK